MKLVIAIIFSLLTFGLMAQVQLELVAEDGRAVEGATVWVQELGPSKRNSFAISDDKGVVALNATAPLVYSISHLGFEDMQDTLRLNGFYQIAIQTSSVQMDEVVVTAQYQPQSARNSVYNVKSISGDRLQQQAATSLEQVLANELNVRFSRDNATGRSGITLQGMSGQYVKVLVDGVPMSGKGGVANDIDLNQIDVQRIERIEVVQGPMAVNYGADALAGVINIITKKDFVGKVEASVTIQEETVGNEYSLFNDGIHSPAVQIGYKPSERWFTQLNARLNHFGGWQGAEEGREKEWYPKTQYFTGGMARYETDKVSTYYRLDYMSEIIQNLGQVNVLANPPRAIDEEYIASRWVHQLQTDISIGKAILNSAISLTDYERRTRRFNVNLATEEESLTSGTGDQDTLFYKTLFIRETVNNLLNGKWGSFQVGTDATLDQAGGSTLSSGVKQINEFGFFTSAEFLFGRLKARAGVRFTRNSAFETTPTPSINFSYQLSPNAQMRWSYGRGYRAPSVRELYHEFIDTNHNILGNPDLKPEYSHSLNADVAKEFDKSGWSVTLGAFFNQIENRITYFVPLAANQPTSYINQSLYKTTGTSIGTSYSSGSVTIKTGFSYIGQYQQLTESERIPSFLFSPEINNQIQYGIAKTGVTVFTFYKFTGPNKQYSLDSNDDVILNRSNGFHMLDFTITKTFFQKIAVGAGAKNLLNVTTVNSNTTGSAHSDSANSVSYGRSFFIRLNYHFKQ